MNGLPSLPMMVSFVGSKERRPLKAMAVTTVGDARKFIVVLEPSLRALKFLRIHILALRRGTYERIKPVERGDDS